MKYIIALISILLGSIAQYLLKTGMNEITQNNNPVIRTIQESCTNIAVISGICCYALSMIFWLFVLSQMELSKAYPLVSLGYIFTLILGYWLLDESITYSKIVGIAFIILGVVIITK